MRVAYKDDVPIAGILSLKYKKTVVYKYSCSDPNYNNLGGTALLLWRTIQSAKEQGCEELDMGRSESENLGLSTFKERWGAKRTESGYFRYPPPSHTLNGKNKASDYKTELGHQVVSILPDSFLIWAGKLLYRHMG